MSTTPSPTETAAAGGMTAPLPGGAAAGAPPADVVPSTPIEFDPRVQLGRSGLRQYGGFLFEEFLHTLRGKEGAKAYREVVENSPLVGGILRLLTLTMRQVNRFVEPFSDDPEDVTRAERVDQALDDMSISWPDLLSEITTMLAYGYAPMEIIWKTCKGYTEDGMTRSRYNDGLIMPRKIYLMAQDTLFRWNFDVDGGVRAMIQLAPPDYVMRTIPIEKMLLFRPDVERGNPEGKSLIRSGYFSWVNIKRLVEFESITAERDAVGIAVARIPAVNMLAGATPSQLAVYNLFKKVVQNVRIDDQQGIVIPSDCYPDTKTPMFDISLMGLSGRATHFDFGAAIVRHEVRLAISMLADIMLLGHDKVGSFALSRDKRTMLSDALGAWLDAIVGVFNRHLFPRIYAYNGWPLDRLCSLGHGGVQVDDLGVLADSLLKMAQAGMPLFPDITLENHIRSEGGLPERTEDDGLDSGQDIEPDESAPAGEQTMPEGALRPPARPIAATPMPLQQPIKSRIRGLVEKYKAQPRSRRGSFHPRSGNVSTALQLLQDRARVGQGDSVNHGFHVTDNPPYDQRDVSQDAIEDAPMERVKLKDLTATQPTVRRDHVRRFLENPGLVVPGQRTLSGQLEDRPVVVRSGGKQYIHDGHKRLSAQVLLGRDDALARVVDLEPHVVGATDPSVTTGYPANAGTPRNAGGPGDRGRAPAYDPNTALAKGDEADMNHRELVEALKEAFPDREVVAQQPAAPAPVNVTANITLPESVVVKESGEALSALTTAVKDQTEATAALRGVAEAVNAEKGDSKKALAMVAAGLKDNTAAIKDQTTAIKGLELKGGDVTVEAAQVNVDVQPTPVQVDVAAPTVNVAAPNVTVEAPAPPEADARTVKEVVRNTWGQIDKIIERPAKDDE